MAVPPAGVTLSPSESGIRTILATTLEIRASRSLTCPTRLARLTL
jgi:hypothetical protein